MSKSLVKLSKKKKRLYEKFLKNRNYEKKLDYKPYKTLMESLKKEIKEELLIHTNIL